MDPRFRGDDIIPYPHLLLLSWPQLTPSLSRGGDDIFLRKNPKYFNQWFCHKFKPLHADQNRAHHAQYVNPSIPSPMMFITSGTA